MMYIVEQVSWAQHTDYYAVEADTRAEAVHIIRTSTAATLSLPHVTALGHTEDGITKRGAVLARSAKDGEIEQLTIDLAGQG